MVSFLKGRRKTDDAVVAVDSSGAHITVALETLVARAETALEQLRAMSGVLDRTAEIDVLRERCEAAERQVAGMEEMMARVSQAEGQLQRVSQSGEQLDQIQVRMGELGGKVEAAIALRDHAEKFLSLEGPLNAARGDADQVRAQLNELGEQVTRMRTQADDALSAHRHATSRLEAFDQDARDATGRLDDVVRRVESVERALEPVGQAVTAIPDVQHKLAVLKALADQVAQKSAALEQQREQVDRAATQISQLTRLDRELDAWLRRQEEQIAALRPDRGQDQRGAGGADQGLQPSRGAAGDGPADRGGPAERPGRAQRPAGADAEEQRELRAGAPGPARRERAGRRLAQRGEGVRGPLRRPRRGQPGHRGGHQPGQGRRRARQRALLRARPAPGRGAADQRGLRGEVERMSASAGEIGDRVRRIEELRPDIEDSVRDLASLKSVKEMMADGLEQMRVAYEEMSRLREGHGEVQAWLQNADAWTKKGAGPSTGTERNGAGGGAVQRQATRSRRPWARSRPGRGPARRSSPA